MEQLPLVNISDHRLEKLKRERINLEVRLEEMRRDRKDQMRRTGEELKRLQSEVDVLTKQIVSHTASRDVATQREGGK